MKKKLPYIPKYLRGRRVPAAAAQAVSCELCGAPLCVTSSGMMACGAHLHGKLRPLREVAFAARAAWPLLDKRNLWPEVVIRRVLRSLETYGVERDAAA